jgi:hypothetical protein
VGLWNWQGNKKPADVVHQCGAHIEKLGESANRSSCVRLAVDCAPVGEVQASTWNMQTPKRLLAAAKRLSIDTEAIKANLKT